MVSVPVGAEPLINRLEGEGIRVLNVSRHGNKLKSGHLHGNKFRIVVRDVLPEAAERLPALIERLRRDGWPNYYGPQRFGRDGETVKLGLAMLQRDTGSDPPRIRSAFLRKFALSAGQSAVFNHYLGQRVQEGLIRRVLQGDVMAKWPFGGLFVAEDVEREQARFDARETVTAGPIIGRKTFAATGVAAERESASVAEAGIPAAALHRFGTLLSGTRRHNLVYADDLNGNVQECTLQLSFTLSAGSYATVLLREITKVQAMDSIEEA
jgi:tRNA pseudouridine13 synthase